MIEDPTYLFTVVSMGRLPILTADEFRARLQDAWLDVRGRLLPWRFPFRTATVRLSLARS
jgi:hypothetical protein